MKKKLLYVVAGLGLVQLAGAEGAFAQEEPRNLDEVVVTASRSPRKQSETGKVVRVISAAQIAKSQGRTLYEVLNTVAGLTIGGNGNNPGDIKAVYLRGASAANTLILIDGIAVNDASGISGEFDIAALAIDQVERIEILKGGNSTLYGSDAVAGVINIITKKGSGKISGSILGTAGNYDTYKLGVGLNGSIGQTAIAFNASGLNSGGMSVAAPATAGAAVDNDAFEQRSAGVNIRQQATERLSFSANVRVNNNKADLDNGAFDDATGYTFSKTNTLYSLAGQYTHNRTILTLQASQNNVRNRYNNNGSLTNNGGNISLAEAVISAPLASFLDLTAGASYRYAETDQKNVFSAPLYADNNIKSAFASFFVKSEGGFRFELGGRYNDHSQYGDNFTYTVNPSWVFADRYKVFANLSSAFRVPSLYQLFSQYGNLDLKPETTTTYEAGTDLNLIRNKLNFSFAYFNRETEDVIIFGAITPTKFGYLNQDKQKDKGFETELGYTISKQVSINAWYAYVTGDLYSNGNKSFYLFRRPKNTYGANLSFDPTPQFGVQLSYKYTDNRTDKYFDPSTFATVEAALQSYNMLDAYIQYKPKPFLTLFADVKNLLDADYTEFAGYTTKGINFNAGLRLEIR